MRQAVNYIALAIPVFFVLIGIEAWIARRGHKPFYRLNDSINDLSCGILQQVLNVFGKAILFGAYALVYEHAAMLKTSAASPAAWILGFLGVDFCYYWAHRISHEMNFLWAAHVVHHQSEEYNLTVALRQSALQPFFFAVFYWPLAIAGLPPLMFLSLDSINTLYQFWIHTRTIGRLGPIEWLFNTPSHHRVHHGCNPKYIDRNHGGTLIVWDRLFGTFQEEEETVVYGVTKPLKSWNPLWANLDYYADLTQIARQTNRLRDKIMIWLRSPAWRPADVPHEQLTETPLNGIKYDARAPRPLRRYAMFWFVTALAATVALLFLDAKLAPAARLLLAAYIIWTLVAIGAVFEGRSWLLASEPIRVFAFGVPALMLLPSTTWQITGAAMLAGLCYFSTRTLWRERIGHLGRAAAASAEQR